MAKLFIGAVARAAGVPISTVRYYQRSGLLDQPARRESGYREYSSEAISRIQFIRHAQELGFSLEQIRRLLTLQATPGARRADVRNEAERLIDAVQSRIQMLMDMQRSLSILLACCDGSGPVEECPILIHLQSTPGEPT